MVMTMVGMVQMLVMAVLFPWQHDLFSSMLFPPQDHSSAPRQRPNKVAHRENHLKFLIARANAPGATRSECFFFSKNDSFFLQAIFKSGWVGILASWKQHPNLLVVICLHLMIRSLTIFYPYIDRQIDPSHTTMILCRLMFPMLPGELTSNQSTEQHGPRVWAACLQTRYIVKSFHRDLDQI